jgi:hypothetical protein
MKQGHERRRRNHLDYLDEQLAGLLDDVCVVLRGARRGFGSPTIVRGMAGTVADAAVDILRDARHGSPDSRAELGAPPSRCGDGRQDKVADLEVARTSVPRIHETLDRSASICEAHGPSPFAARLRPSPA